LSWHAIASPIVEKAAQSNIVIVNVLIAGLEVVLRSIWRESGVIVIRKY
jgi:hypothetical protein